ncbi:hypothetical protein, partial [Enterobacter asburiae]
PCLRGRALEEVEYGGEYLRVIHGSALKKRWGAAPPPTLSDAPPRRIGTPKNISLNNIRSHIKKKKKTPQQTKKK